ncbi:MAG: Flp pilus assembly complex ATPase component TadA [Holosporaceae bacterium]|jgi:type II secretory ATPase GspE/PulE/Tfp pilus assembly ATPase PilB-like protein|nr:Flp pilus assembly complex ATPase component TadA [Holosporaceae bacterium]
MEKNDFTFQCLGNILVQKGLLTQKQVEVVLNSQKTRPLLFGQLAVQHKFLGEDDLLQILAKLYSMDSITLEFACVDAAVLGLIDHETALSCLALPFFRKGNHLKIAMADPGDLKALDKIKAIFKNMKTEFFLAKESEILRFIEILRNGSNDIDDNNPLLLLNKIIFDALESGASDIHFEPLETHVRVRSRIDGLLQQQTSLSFDSWSRIKAKLKLTGKLDITDRHHPQSGHAKISLGGKSVDLRISTHIDKSEESIAIRILDASSGIKSLEELEFPPEDLLWLKKVISFHCGIFLIAGPTGSGKTTTLYSLLKEIDDTSIHIMTLEDPIEYQMDGINQMELRENGLLSFADGVRSILRQDPDVVFIGEIRDEETAHIALRASLTGRLVLASIHASTPLEGIRRLVNLNLKLSDIVPSLIGIFSQRLVRKIDGGSGTDKKYAGRFPLTEYIYFSEEKKKLLLASGDIYDLQLDKTFAKSSAEAIRRSLTDICEVERVIKNVDI